MRVIKWIFIAFGCFVAVGIIQTAYEISHRLIFGKASYSTEAVFSIPQTNTEIGLERRCIHLFLAEYERTIVLRVGGKEVLRGVAAEDSGGYSRMNVYQNSPTEYFLSGGISFDKYELDISRQKITRISLAEKPLTAQFIGAFDSEEKRKWRFIPAGERVEQPNKTRQQENYQ